MIEFYEAQKLIEEHTKTLQPVKLPLMESLGCALAENIFTKTPIPIFDSSAVDGYGVKVSDIRNASKENPVVMKLVGEIKAGDSSKLKLSRGECVRILTGAPVPLSIEAVVMKEFTKQVGDKIIFITSSKLGENKRYKGEEFKKGDKVILANTFVSPPVIGLLATLGIPKVKVFRKPKIAVLVTGNELVPIGKKIKPGQIYDSNYYTLSSALKQIGIEPTNLGIAKDDKKDLLKKIRYGLDNSDILLVSGGISVGEYDYVQDIFDELRVKKIFWCIAMKPGKPTYFGIKGKKLIFGLPGNPVASLLVFNQLVKLAIKKVMGEKEPKGITLFAKLAHDLKKRSKRLEFVRGILKSSETGEITVTATRGQDSHMLGGMVEANCLIHFPKDEEILSKGIKVKVELINN